MFILSLLSFSVISIVIGFFDYRSTLLNDYSNHINEWESEKRQEFSSLGISVAEVSNTSEVGLLRQNQDSSMIKQDTYTTIPTYNPLFYSISLYNSKNFNLTELLYLNIKVSEVNTTNTINLPSLQVFKTTKVTALRSGCKSLGGSYEGFGNCVISWVRNK